MVVFYCGRSSIILKSKQLGSSVLVRAWRQPASMGRLQKQLAANAIGIADDKTKTSWKATLPPVSTQTQQVPSRSLQSSSRDHILVKKMANGRSRRLTVFIPDWHEGTSCALVSSVIARGGRAVTTNTENPNYEVWMNNQTRTRLISFQKTIQSHEKLSSEPQYTHHLDASNADTQRSIFEHYKNDPTLNAVDAIMCGLPAAQCEVFLPFNKTIIFVPAYRLLMKRCETDTSGSNCFRPSSKDYHDRKAHTTWSLPSVNMTPSTPTTSRVLIHCRSTPTH